MKYTDKQIDTLLKALYEGRINPSMELPEDLYLAIGEYLEKGLYNGYGSTLEDLDFDSVDYKLLNELRDNVYIFSGAKTYQQCLQMSDLVAQSSTFADFKKNAMAVYDEYNVNWLRSEYNTAVGQATQAAQWADIEQDKELFPYLRYKAVLDANTSEICRPLDGITLPVDSPLWSKYAPLNHFNCFTPETKVLTLQGWQRIDKIEKGQLVIGGSGNAQNVIGIHIKDINEEILQIIIKNNSISSTKNHRFLTLQGWKRAENIFVGDVIVQNIQVGIFNKIICAIHNCYIFSSYLAMSVKRKWKSRMVDAFNTNIKVGQKNINKPSIHKFIANTFNSIASKKIINLLFVVCKWLMVLPVFLGVFFIGLNSFIVSFFSNFFNKHGVIDFHSFRSVRAFFTKHWMNNRFFHFGKSIRSLLSSVFGIQPLSFYSFASSSGLQFKLFKKTHEGPVINTPYFADFSVTKAFDKIKTDEGFTNGQPLDRFNSLFDFVTNSLIHRKIVLVENVKKIDYTGQIYNLSVNSDESYITSVGVVHNCRCILEKIDKYETVRVTRKATVDKVVKELDVTVQPEFKMNAGKDGYVFSPKHPYFDVQKKDRDFARRNFDLPIPPTKTKE